MTLSAEEIDSRSSDTITTTREPLLSLIEEIVNMFGNLKMDDDEEEGQEEMAHLEKWRKIARRTLKRFVPYIGTYRRDVPPLHKLAEYTFPRLEYEAFWKIFTEIKNGVGQIYRFPSQLPFIGLGDSENPFEDDQNLFPPQSTFSPIMVHLCLAQKCQFLYERLCRSFNRSPTLATYLDHPFRRVSLDLSQLLEDEWMTTDEVATGSARLVFEAQRQVLQEIEKGLDWETIRIELDRRLTGIAGSDADRWEWAGKALHRILRENLAFVRKDEQGANRMPSPKIYLPAIAHALQSRRRSGKAPALLEEIQDDASSSDSTSTRTFALSHPFAGLTSRQTAVYHQYAHV